MSKEAVSKGKNKLTTKTTKDIHKGHKALYYNYLQISVHCVSFVSIVVK